MSSDDSLTMLQKMGIKFDLAVKVHRKDGTVENIKVHDNDSDPDSSYAKYHVSKKEVA